MGRSDRECGIVYANPNKNIERLYGTWLRAPVRGGKNLNIGVKWLRNATDGAQSWNLNSGSAGSSTNVNPSSNAGAKIMELDGQMDVNEGEAGAICFIPKNQGFQSQDNVTTFVEKIEQSGKKIENNIIVLDPKRKKNE